MSEGPPRRALLAVVVVAAVALVCLLLGHRALDGYLHEQQTKSAPAATLPDTSGAAGQVSFADGAPAAEVRVKITWRDSGDREGSTPALTDGKGVFAQGNIPYKSNVTEIRAWSGPLLAVADASQIDREGTSAGRARLTFPKEFRLAGRLRRSGDRAPVAGATLAVGGVRAISGADGEFVVERVPAAVIREVRPVVRVEAGGITPLDWPLPKDLLPEAYGDLTIVAEPAK